MATSDELIDHQRKEFENPTEWRRRRAFLLLNFNEVPFDRLVCLSHCYVNSSMHGAAYPERVMDEVEQYSRNIDGYLTNGGGGGGGADQRASSAHKRKAAATAGHQSGSSGEPPWKRLAASAAAMPQAADMAGGRGNQASRPRPLDLDSQLLATASSSSSAASSHAAPIPDVSADADGQAASEIVLPADLNLAEFYLREIETDDPVAATNPANVLKCSADFCHRTLDYHFEGESGPPVKCRLLLDGRPVASATAANKLAAKAAVSTGVLAALRRRCFTLVVRSDRAFILAQADAGFARPTAAADGNGNTAAAAVDGKIGAENVGHRLLKGMGWSGSGGLGKHLDGRAEPVVGDVRVVSRAGLGADVGAGASAAFQAAVGQVLRDFQRDRDDRDDLFFAADFTNEERKHVHSMCLKLGLASRSYGAKDGQRCLVVSRKRTATQLVDFVRRNGGSTVRYRLLPPETGEGDGDGGGDASAAADSDAAGLDGPAIGFTS